MVERGRAYAAGYSKATSGPVLIPAVPLDVPKEAPINAREDAGEFHGEGEGHAAGGDGVGEIASDLQRFERMMLRKGGGDVGMVRLML